MPLNESPSKSDGKAKIMTSKSGSSSPAKKSVNKKVVSANPPPRPEDPVTSSANGKNGQQQQQEEEVQQREEPEQQKPAKKKRPLHPIEILLGEVLVNAAGETTSPKKFVAEGAVIGLYFAAHWCPPCKMLSPTLMLLYEEVRKAEHKFEIIYVSSDVKDASFKEYLSVMPWWAVPFDEDERRESLAVEYGVSGIPLFLLIDAKTLEVITRQGRIFVSTDPRGEKFPWKDMPLPSVTKVELLPPSTGSSKQEAISGTTNTNAEEDEPATDEKNSKSKSEEDTNSKANKDDEDGNKDSTQPGIAPK